MLFAIGTKVKFLHSKDEGVVTALLDNDMVTVLLDGSSLEIPAFINDLIRAEDYIDRNPSVKAKIVPGKQKKPERPPVRPAVESQYTILKSLGIQLAFDPVINKDGETERFNLFLINDTRLEFLFTLKIILENRAVQQYDGKLESVVAYPVGELLFDQLNDAPGIEIECWKITTEGRGHRLFKTFRIRPKQFFRQVRTAPLLNKRVHLYKVFERFDPSTEKKEEDLQSYTQRRSQPAPPINQIREPLAIGLAELAEFVPEIDLHIDKLAPHPKKLKPAEILRIQLSHFENFMATAIRLEADRVFVIHGVGKGRLRQAIAEWLEQAPEVKSFKNEFHPHYGYGATEVEF